MVYGFGRQKEREPWGFKGGIRYLLVHMGENLKCKSSENNDTIGLIESWKTETN